MGVVNRRTVYHFAEMIDVQSESGESDPLAVDFFSIPDRTIVEQVLVRIQAPAVGASNLIVGDDDDDNGYITAKDATAAVGTVYGEDPVHRGTYLYDDTKKGGFVKVYGEAGKTLKLKLTAKPTTEGTFQVIVFGKRFGV